MTPFIDQKCTDEKVQKKFGQGPPKPTHPPTHKFTWGNQLKNTLFYKLQNNQYRLSEFSNKSIE